MSHMGRIHFEREEPPEGTFSKLEIVHTGEFARGFLNGLLLATIIWGAVFAAAFATGAL